MSSRTIDQDEVLDLVNCAEDYGHWNSVCMFSLYDFAKPVTDNDIKRYSLSLKDSNGYGDEDREGAIERLTEWRDRFNPITNGE
jgi:hypothetical protein